MSFECVSFKNKAPQPGSGKYTARVRENTQSDPGGRERGNTRSSQRWTFFDFSFKKSKVFASPRFQEPAGGERGGGFCSRRWSVMSHGAGYKRVACSQRGLPVRGRRGRLGTRRASAKARDSCAGTGGDAGCGRGASQRQRRTWSGARPEVGVARRGVERCPWGTEEAPVRWQGTDQRGRQMCGMEGQTGLTSVNK